MVLAIFVYKISLKQKSFKDVYDDSDIDYDKQARKRRIEKMKKLNQDISAWIKEKKQYLDSI